VFFLRENRGGPLEVRREVNLKGFGGKKGQVRKIAGEKKKLLQKNPKEKKQKRRTR